MICKTTKDRRKFVTITRLSCCMFLQKVLLDQTLFVSSLSLVRLSWRLSVIAIQQLLPTKTRVTSQTDRMHCIVSMTSRYIYIVNSVKILDIEWRFALTKLKQTLALPSATWRSTPVDERLLRAHPPGRKRRTSKHTLDLPRRKTLRRPTMEVFRRVKRGVRRWKGEQKALEGFYSRCVRSHAAKYDGLQTVQGTCNLSNQLALRSLSCDVKLKR